MSAAAFVLAINFCVAGLFATAFMVVAINARNATGARWLAMAYGAGMLNVGFELILPFQSDPDPVGIGIFTAFLFALVFSVVGLARNYSIDPPWRVLAVIVVLSMIDIVAIIDMERSLFVRGLLYQLPYALLQLLGAWVVLRARRRQILDVALIVINVLAALQFLGKPFLATALGSGANAQAYIGTNYAAFSQTAGAVLLIANGIVMLVIILRDTMTEMRTQSATDPLSGLLNRRGFSEQADQIVVTARRNKMPLSLVLADLDHFKAVNDVHGHAVGDEVIRQFALAMNSVAEMATTMVTGPILGRLGGEEFAVLVPGTGLDGAQLFAARIQARFGHKGMIETAPEIKPTASFGVAQLGHEESLFDLMRRTDRALYDAKRQGRNQICVAPHTPSLPPPPPRPTTTSRPKTQLR